MSERKTMTSAEAEGRRIIQPFATRFAELRRDLELNLRELSDEELEQVEQARRWFGHTNCWWAEFRFARAILDDEIKVERNRRTKAGVAA